MSKLLMASNFKGDSFNYIAFSIIAISTSIGFLLAGFYGVILVALGIIGAPVIFIAMTATAGILESGFNFN